MYGSRSYYDDDYDNYYYAEEEEVAHQPAYEQRVTNNSHASSSSPSQYRQSNRPLNSGKFAYKLLCLLNPYLDDTRTLDDVGVSDRQWLNEARTRIENTERDLKNNNTRTYGLNVRVRSFKEEDLDKSFAHRLQVSCDRKNLSEVIDLWGKGYIFIKLRPVTKNRSEGIPPFSALMNITDNGEDDTPNGFEIRIIKNNIDSRFTARNTEWRITQIIAQVSKTRLGLETARNVEEATPEEKAIRALRNRALSWTLNYDAPHRRTNLEIDAAHTAWRERAKQGDENLPNQWVNSNSYYNAFLNPITEEAAASIESGLENKQSFHFQLLRNQTKLKSTSENIALLTWNRKLPQNISDEFPASDLVVELSPRMIRDKSFLAVASQSTDSNNVTFRIQMEERDLAFYSGLVKSDWDVYALSSLVTYGRMYAACHLKSKPSFYRQIYRANISAWPDAEIETKAEEESEERSNQGRRLNSIQQQVVEECVNAPNDSVRLIQGPPGTGKTTTILELLNRLTAPVDDTTARLNSIIYGQENTVQRIWVCAPSNKAVQILAKGFRKNNPNIPIFLVGIEKKLDASLRPIFFDTWLENKVDDCQKAKAAIDKVLALTQENFNDNSEKRNSTIVRRLSALGNALKNVQRHHDLEHYGFSAQAVDAIQSITRSTGRVREYKKSPEEFLENLKKNASDERHFLRERENEINTIAQDLLIEKDELLNRGQIIFSTLVTSGRKMMRDSEAPHTLIVDEAGQSTEAEMLIAFREETKRAFIVGDPKQLPATVQSRLNNLENNRFQQSMLGRLLDDCKQPHKMLNVQYRMHPEICEFPSNKYYEESLESDPSIDDRTTRIYDDEFIEAYQMINCKGKEKRDGTSHFNEKEIEIIITLLKHFQKNQHLDINISNDVGIISGYSAQVRKMKEALSQNGLPTEIINTVDGFQGGEKRIIMMSCVRTNPQNDIGFWRSAQRLNVAITRAQEALFIIGDANTLRNATYRDEPLDFAALIEDADRRGCIVNGNNLLRRLNPQDTENKSHPKPKRKKSKKPKQKAEEKASDEKTSSSSKKDIEKKYDAESGRFFTKPKKKKNRPPRSQKKNQNTSSNTPKK